MADHQEDLVVILGSEYNPSQHLWLRNHARRVVCGIANDVEDARQLLNTLGLLDDSRISTVDGIGVPQKRPN